MRAAVGMPLERLGAERGLDLLRVHSAGESERRERILELLLASEACYVCSTSASAMVMAVSNLARIETVPVKGARRARGLPAAHEAAEAELLLQRR